MVGMFDFAVETDRRFYLANSCRGRGPPRAALPLLLEITLHRRLGLGHVPRRALRAVGAGASRFATSTLNAYPRKTCSPSDADGPGLDFQLQVLDSSRRVSWASSPSPVVASPVVDARPWWSPRAA